MFLNYIKDFYVKRKLKNSLHNLKSNILSVGIETVGLLIDASHFTEKEALIKELIANGIPVKSIKTIVYKDRFKLNDVNSQLGFTDKHLNWKGEIKNPNVNDFINEKFDLLISYYDVEKAILMLITHNSKAVFKAGFSTIDKKLNHLTIDMNVKNYKIFTAELFRYLKLFKQNIIQ
ncbi:DUF6913 domain-containing protein [Flavobacterium sp. LB3P45]|uniref:DUF6913 domain-containing protein n=1 Tax=Flavobacterium fructosi TaxID=3230416 RepID=A0ABW6HNJ5_9FLAO